MKFLVLILLIVANSTAAAVQPAADLVLINGNIRTIDRKLPRAEAMAVRDGIIIAVGRNAGIRRLAGPATRVIDARGKLVLPGFNDSHVHLTGIGNQFSHLDLRGVTSQEEILSEIARYAAFLPSGRWIIAGGLNETTLVPSGPISLDALDKASKDHPLLIYIEGGKSVVANSAAMKRAGVTADSRNPSDGQIVRDHAGKLRGVFTGNAAHLIRRHIPSDHGRDWPQIIEAASNYAASLGVTSVQDVHSDDLVDVLRTLDKAGRLKTRVYECLGIDAWKKASRSSIGLVTSGCVKGVAFGIEEEVSELQQKVSAADQAGLQVTIHAIGARAIRNTLNAFESSARVNGKRDRRFRVEHAARADPADLPLFVRSGTIASMQPHLFYSGPEYGENYRSILDGGVVIALGSDASMTDLNPLFGISAAVNSGNRSFTVEEAVRAYTDTSAFAEFQNDKKGTLSKGKAADFVILSEDIFAIDPQRIRTVRVLLTVVNGKVVYDVL